MLPDEQSTPEQIAIYRQMTPGRRLSLAEQLYWSAREIKAAWLRAQHADLERGTDRARSHAGLHECPNLNSRCCSSEPRLTHDVDFVVYLRADDVPRLCEMFPSPEFYLPPPEAIHAELARERRGHFNAIHTDTGFKADFYPAGREEFHAWAFRHARRVEYRGEPVTVAPPEYVIVRKLEYFREGGSEKHLRDIRSIWNISGDQMERAALDEWIGRQGVVAQWQQAVRP